MRVLAVAVGGAAVLASLAGCSSTSAGTAGVDHTRYTVLPAGRYGGIGWQLDGWSQDHHLCLMLLPRGADPEHPTAAGSWPAAGGGACEFDRRDRSTGYYAGSTGPAGSTFAFGPLPAAATDIRVAAHEILPTRLLPSGRGLPAGRFWLHLMPPGWPSAADGSALATPQPLAADGRPVPFRDF